MLMLVDIENDLYQFKWSGTFHIYTLGIWGLGVMQGPNKPKIDIYALIRIYTLNVISEIYLYRSTRSGICLKNSALY